MKKSIPKHPANFQGPVEEREERLYESGVKVKTRKPTETVGLSSLVFMISGLMAREPTWD